jgi:PadR family transcriptional regulator AphA
MKQLTTTSYAILSQLALQDWTTYALAAEMRRNLHYFWPRAESGIYAEIKWLAEAGYAASEKRYIGKRPQTTYTITLKGKKALDAWLTSPLRPISLEFEGLLRLFGGETNSLSTIYKVLQQTQSDADELIGIGQVIGVEYLNGTAPFQDKIYIRAFIYDFLLHYAELQKEWAARVQVAIEKWEQMTESERNEQGLEIIRQTYARIQPDSPNPYEGLKQDDENQMR